MGRARGCSPSAWPISFPARTRPCRPPWRGHPPGGRTRTRRWWPGRREGERRGVSERESCSLVFFHSSLNRPPPPRKQSRTHSGKTSLLFHYAHTVAAAGGRAVILLPRPPFSGSADGDASAPPLPANPPLLPPGADPGDPAWARASIKWVASLADVQAYGACLHLLAPEDAPDAVLVDDVLSLPAEAPPVAAAAHHHHHHHPGDASAAAGASAPFAPPPPRPPADRRATEHALARAMALLVDGVTGRWGDGAGQGEGGQQQEPEAPAPPRRRPGKLVFSVRTRPTGGGVGGGDGVTSSAPPMMHLVTRWAPLVLVAAPGPAGFEFGEQHQAPPPGRVPAAASVRAAYRVSGREGLAADGVVQG